MEIVERNISSNDWITVIFLIVMLLLVASKKLYGERFYDFSRIILSNKYFTTQKKSLAVLDIFTFLLYLTNGLITSLALGFLFKGLHLFPAKSNSVVLFIQIFLGYNVLIGVKYFIEKIIANIFSIENVLDNYIFYKITYKNLLALFLLPVTIFLAYAWDPSQNIFIIGLVLVLFFNVLILLGYYQKNQKIVFDYWFYFILYLCTLEIAPYFILYKVVTHAN